MTTKSRAETETAEAPSTEAQAKPVEERHDGKRALTITVPLPPAKQIASGAVNTALLPVAVARRVLPAKGGLPLYVGLGVLGATDVVDWPVAIGIGVGYAMLRRWGPLAPERTASSRTVNRATAAAPCAPSDR